jgi:hypothetical protein
MKWYKNIFYFVLQVCNKHSFKKYFSPFVKKVDLHF